MWKIVEPSASLLQPVVEKSSQGQMASASLEKCVARKELALMEGPGRARFEDLCGAAEIARQIGTWRAMIVVLDTGEHCPHHFRALKPA
jgi:hypothetical protein